ncbi:unnamed protein product [Fraxinus pennsylvanica]|uniref:Uncharacterized protein n=1 Tax=Fraxinus pennsylvanica TaxID=56036 RepID=A0AAD2AET8_9LAMI|nr:unnamed protein product [Fraxinus pennsylvanica]
MRAFLKSLDEHIWFSVVNGWIVPNSTVNNEVIPTLIANWTRVNSDECNRNSKALHTLFMAVSLEEFRRVSMNEEAKEVWDILHTKHEGTQVVKNSKFRMLTTSDESKGLDDREGEDGSGPVMTSVGGEAGCCGEEESEADDGDPGRLP